MNNPIPPAPTTPDVVEPELGRRITMDDVIRAHRHPAKCLCRGTAVVAKYQAGKRVEKICEKAVADVRKKHGKDLRDTKNGPHWIKGREPEAVKLAQA